jgi:hypothetical protein
MRSRCGTAWGVGVDREDDAIFSGAAHEFVVKVRPVREGVDFQGRVGAPR